MNAFFKFIRRLSSVERCQGRSTTQRYSVADHSFRASLIAMRLADEYPLPGIDVAKVIKGALLHDIEEALFGDVPRPFKKAYLKTYKEDAEVALYSEGVLSAPYLKIWKECKDVDTEEGYMVELADRLELLVHSSDEIKQGNMSTVDIYYNLMVWFDENKVRIRASFPFAETLIREAKENVVNSNIQRQSI